MTSEERMALLNGMKQIAQLGALCINNSVGNQD